MHLLMQLATLMERSISEKSWNSLLGSFNGLERGGTESMIRK